MSPGADASDIFDAWRKKEVLSILPTIDLNYRRAVHKQNQAATQASAWYADDMPIILERHQQHIEDIKSFAGKMMDCSRETSVELSAAASTAIHANKEIDSVRIISPHHEQVEVEMRDSILEPIKYRNYLNGGQVSRPIFGLGAEETSLLITQIIGVPRSSQPYVTVMRSAEMAFRFERKSMKESDVTRRLQSLDTQSKNYLLINAMGMDEPLLRVDSIVKELAQSKGGLPRTKIKPFLERAFPSHRRQSTMVLLFRLVEYWKWTFQLHNLTQDAFEMVSGLLFHSREYSELLASVWRKWDPTCDQPLPDGVERQWNRKSRSPEVVWMKTGWLYTGNVAKS